MKLQDTHAPPAGWLRQSRDALFPAALKPHAQVRQRAVLQRRLRGLARVSAALVLAWVLVEAAVLSGPDFAALALCRGALAAMLVLLSFGAPRISPMAGMVALVLVEAVSFGVMQALLPVAAPQWLHFGYWVLPLLMVAQLGILPLPASRTLLLAVPALALVMAMATTPPQAPPHGEDLLHTLWLLALMLALAAWAAAAQYRLFAELLVARWDAAHDPMTGLPNRRAFMARVESERARSARSGAALSLLMLDLDRFKAVNDSHGHACGDEVLRTSASVLESALRGSDVAGRIGGEEFAVLLIDTALPAARLVAERIRAEVAAATVSCNGHAVHWTISIGVAQLQRGESQQALLERADAALYAAKAAGRNRVMDAAAT